MCAAEAQKIPTKTIETQKEIRWDEKCEIFWKDIQNKAGNLRINPSKLPRKRTTPPKIEKCPGGNAAPGFDENIISYYRKFYYKALDCIIDTIIDRLTNKILKRT